jgi:hypothetical protein
VENSECNNRIENAQLHHGVSDPPEQADISTGNHIFHKLRPPELRGVLPKKLNPETSPHRTAMRGLAHGNV